MIAITLPGKDDHVSPGTLVAAPGSSLRSPVLAVIQIKMGDRYSPIGPSGDWQGRPKIRCTPRHAWTACRSIDLAQCGAARCLAHCKNRQQGALPNARNGRDDKRGRDD
jgi:hypothetical protein